MPSFALQVAVFAPLRSQFHYLPSSDGSIPAPGCRVRVPFGRGQRIGIVTAHSAPPEEYKSKLKSILGCLDEQPLLSPAHLQLLDWIADYYQHPVGEVYATALPVLMREGRAIPTTKASAWGLTDLGKTTDAESLRRAPRQQAILQLLQRDPKRPWPTQALRDELGDCRSQLHILAERGLTEAVSLNPNTATTPQPGPALNPEQQTAVDALLARPGFQVHLLQGVTGSGKTEVYLRLSQQLLDQGKQVLMLVPEISLTPQTTQRFRERLGLEPALLHSGLAQGERARHWLRATRGEARLVLGTRSSVLTPLPDLGLIIVDEEHDLSFKQREGFHYAARDLAILRASRVQCPVILGSATPSLESLHNVARGRFQCQQLTQRAGQAQSPRLQLLDIRSAPLQAGLSPALINTMALHLERGEQVMLFLNRRGFAPILICHACGWIGHCRHCDARLTVHRQNNRLCCHHCGHSQPLPTSCPACHHPRLLTQGVGTEQLESFLEQRFPSQAVVRVDRDTTRRKGSLQALLGQIHQGQPGILLGTQMLAKGHDFPNVTLVGLLDIDQGLFGADFRAPERMGQLLIQVAGRAGRAEKPGLVLIQSRQPDHPWLQILLEQGYPAFAEALLAERQAADFPPFSFQALLRADGPDAEAVSAFAQRALEKGQQLGHAGIELLGPAPAIMERRAGRYRFHLLAQSQQRPQLQAFVRDWVPTVGQLSHPKQLRWSLDIDPQEL